MSTEPPVKQVTETPLGSPTVATTDSIHREKPGVAKKSLGETSIELGQAKRSRKLNRGLLTLLVLNVAFFLSGVFVWTMAIWPKAGLATIGGFQGSQRRPFNPSKFEPVTVLRKPIRAITKSGFSVKSVEEAKKSMRPPELVLGVGVGNASRAYPINMLTGPSREILNDTLGGRAIAATW